MTQTHKTLTLQCPHCDRQKDIWIGECEDRTEEFFCCRAYDVTIQDSTITAWTERKVRTGQGEPNSWRRRAPRTIECEMQWNEMFYATFDNYDGPGDLIGCGKDAQEAICDLLDQAENA